MNTPSIAPLSSAGTAPLDGLRRFWRTKPLALAAGLTLTFVLSETSAAGELPGANPIFRDAIRAFAYDLGLTLKKQCLLY